tara:strand:- start:24334 stop:25377 length:1044 start_codon:yes stop_codon:yes gene_type:complete
VATIRKINGVCRDNITALNGTTKVSMNNRDGFFLLTPLWVCVGRDGYIMYSSDAISWSEYVSTASGSPDYWDVSFGKDSNNNQRWFIPTNSGPELRYSADPTAGDSSWASKDIPGIPGGDVRTVEYGVNGTWIAGGGEDNVLRSTDGGDTWTEITAVAAGAGTMYCLATNGEGTWLAGGNGTSVLKSTDDGLNWYVSGTSVGQVNGLEYNNGVWFLASNTTSSYRATAIADNTSTDTWSAVTGISEEIWAICHITGDTWMTANKLNSPSGPYLSTDNCASWNPVSSPSVGQIMGLASDGTTVVVCSKDSKIHTSTDNGSSWTLRFTTTSADALVVDYNKIKPFDICT